MAKKLLVVCTRSPEKSLYMEPAELAVCAFFWGKRVDQYPTFIVETLDDGSTSVQRLEWDSNDVCAMAEKVMLEIKGEKNSGPLYCPPADH
jgi:hypothetical protein